MTSKSEYRRKLQDPRWQKKRLSILERDNFKCRMCGYDKETLHVHHKHYNGCDPWDIHDDALVTLCSGCHENESIIMSDMATDISTVLRRYFSGEELQAILSMIIKRCNVDDYGTRNFEDCRMWFLSEREE